MSTRGNPVFLRAALIFVLAGAVVLILASQVECQERPGMKVALAAMAIGQGLDTASTLHALSRGAVEANPIYGARPSAAKLIAGKLPMIGVGYLLTKIAPRHPKLARGLAYTIGGVGAGLAIHNARQARR
jgi:hypothetical protein